MFRKWTEVLPLFILRKIALRRCCRISMGNHVVVQVRPDVLILVSDPVKANEPNA